jgi:transcriptional regulator with XRE-family HTH domain
MVVFSPLGQETGGVYAIEKGIFWMEDVGEVIRRRISTRLDRLGLTAITAAERAGLPRDAIRNLYRGDGSVPRADTLSLIARALHTSIAYLTGEAPFPTTEAAEEEGDPRSRDIPVVCDLEWGRFAAPDERPTGETIPVAVHGYEDAALFAGRMIDGHANLMFRVGTYVIFAPWTDSGMASADTVLVKRERDGKLEFTVRWLDKSKKNNLQLTPVRFGSAYKDMKPVRFGTIFDEVSVVGIAVAAFWVIDRPVEGDRAYPASLSTEAEDAGGRIVRSLSDDPADDIAFQLGGIKPTT